MLMLSIREEIETIDYNIFELKADIAYYEEELDYIESDKLWQVVYDRIQDYRKSILKFESLKNSLQYFLVSQDTISKTQYLQLIKLNDKLFGCAINMFR